MKNKKYLLALLALVAVSAIFIWKRMTAPPLEVWVSAVERGLVESTVSNTRAGTVKACKRSRLSMPGGGIVDRLLVSEGDRVETGQLLLELWNQDRKAEALQAKQMLAVAQDEQRSACLLAELKARDSARVDVLRKRKLASDEDQDSALTTAQSQQRMCDAAKHQAGVAEANLALRQAILERTRLHAPFAGIVAEVNGEVGEYITPSPPGIPTPAAVDLIDDSCLYVAAPIDEIDASRLQAGMPARVSLDAYRDLMLTGMVSRIAPYVIDLEKQARTVEVEVRLDPLPEDVQLLVGYSADMTLVQQRRDDVLRIPSAALLGGDAQVWVLADGQIHRRKVEVGISNWSFTEILSGLKVGDWVVRSPDLPGIDDGVKAMAKQDTTGDKE